MKHWIKNAIKYLDLSLGTIPQELNELDWKETLSPNNDKLCKHISAFSNHPGGGFIVFGIDNKTGDLLGVTKELSDSIIDKLSNLCRDKLNPVAIMDHAIIDFRNKQLLCVYIKESAIKPVHIASKSIEECYIRTGASSRKASRQEVGSLLLNSKTPVFEELNASKLKNKIEVIGVLDYKTIYSLLNKPVPSTMDSLAD